MERFSKKGKQPLKYQRRAEDSRDSVPSPAGVCGSRQLPPRRRGDRAGGTPEWARGLRPRRGRGDTAQPNWGAAGADRAVSGAFPL